MLPAVDIAVEAAGLGEQRRRLEIDHPAPDPHAVVQALGLGRRRGFARIAGDGVLMQMRDMGIVEQIVDQKLRIRIDAQIARRQRPALVGEPGQLDDLRIVGACRIAHPDPDDVPALGDRIGAHARTRTARCPVPGLKRTALWRRRSGRDSRSAGDRPRLRRATAALRDGSSDPPAPPACRCRRETAPPARPGRCAPPARRSGPSTRSPHTSRFSGTLLASLECQPAGRCRESLCAPMLADERAARSRPGPRKYSRRWCNPYNHASQRTNLRMSMGRPE